MFRPLLGMALAATAALAQTFGTTESAIVAAVQEDSSSTASNKLALRVPVSFGLPATMEVAYVDSVTTVGGQTMATFEETLSFTFTKTQPKNLYALSPMGTVNPLVTLAGGSSVSWTVYAVAPPQRAWQVTLQILKGTTVMNSYTLATDAPLFLDKSSSHPVLAGLENEAPPPVAPPDFSGYVVCVPSAPAGDPAVQSWMNRMLLVPRDQVPASAQELMQMLQADLDPATQDPLPVTKYLLNGLWLFQDTLADMQAMGGLVLETLSPELCFTTVDLLLDNAQLNMVTNRAQGTVAGTLQQVAPGSRNGILAVTVENTGTLYTGYIVTVTNASPSLGPPPPPQACALGPGQSANLQFRFNGAAAASGPVSCLLTLNWGDGTLSGSGNAVASCPVNAVFQ